MKIGGDSSLYANRTRMSEEAKRSFYEDSYSHFSGSTFEKGRKKEKDFLVVVGSKKPAIVTADSHKLVKAAVQSELAIKEYHIQEASKIMEQHPAYKNCSNEAPQKARVTAIDVEFTPIFSQGGNEPKIKPNAKLQKPTTAGVRPVSSYNR